MAENSEISWTDHTFNGWVGCTKVSPACDGCYAEHLMATRHKRVVWGAPGKGEGTRDRTSEANWAKPLAWDRKAARELTPTFVFCSSLADVFDNAVPPQWRADLFDLIRATPHLTWLLLTKRPGNIQRLYEDCRFMTKEGYGPHVSWPRNAAIGCTVVTQEEADRDVWKLIDAKRALRPAFAFLSMEPLLGSVDLHQAGAWRYPSADGIDWVITGGETDQGKHKARPSDPAWFRSLRDQCAAAGVPFHFKQWGEWQEAMWTERMRGAVAQVFVETANGRESWVYDPGPDTLNPNTDHLRIFGYEVGMAIEMGRTRAVARVGKAHDPCTLDGVLHDARPVVGVTPNAA